MTADSPDVDAVVMDFQAELRNRAVLATNLSIVLADAAAPDWPLVWVNPAFTTATGYPFDEAVGRNCRFLQSPETDGGPRTQIRDALTGGRDTTVTLLNTRKDGTTFWNQVSLSPIRDAGGKLTHFVGIQVDVTARVVADQERDRAHALERAARQDAERAHDQLALLAEATSVLSATLDVGEALERLTHLVVPILADWVLLVVPDRHGRIGQVLTHHRDGREQEMTALADAVAASSSSDSILNQILSGAPGRLISDYAGADSALLVPIPGRRSVLAAMALLRRRGTPAYTEQDLAIATDLGRRAGITLDNARLYESEHRIAETLQRSLLPELPQIEGIVAAARYLASESGANVGGDFYDVIDLPDGALGIAIGDVVGHDVLAAAAMGHLRGLLRASAWDTETYAQERGERQDPADVLARVDRLILGLHMTTMATVAYARLEALHDGSSRWLLRWCYAGHPPLLLRHPDGSVEVLDENPGLLLGVDVRRPRATGQRMLAPGTTVLAYTDGLVERRGESLSIGIARLQEVFAAAPSHVEALCDHLLAQFGDSEDDVALLALQL